MTDGAKSKLARASWSLPRAKPILDRANNTCERKIQSPPWWMTLVACLLLALGVWVVFGQTLHHEFFNFDDPQLVSQNSMITQGLSLKGVVRVFTHVNADEWWPLTSLSHMVDWQLYGLNPWGHHLTNVLLHAATAILLLLALRSMTRAFGPSAFVAAAFALHPLRVESVAWVAERKDVLSGLFFMLTLGAYARYVRRLGARRGKLGGQTLHADIWPLLSGDYWLVMLLFALGLLSKTMLVTLPFVLLLLDYWPLARMPRGWSIAAESKRRGDYAPPSPCTFRRLVIEKLPFFFLSAAACAATILVQEKAITGAVLPLGPRIGNALLAYAVYIRQMLYPVGLAVLYPHPGTQLSTSTVGLCVLILSLITLYVARWRLKRPYLLVGWLWYVGMLLPVIGILQVGPQARADRYTYLPQIGLYIMAAWAAVDWAGARPGRRIVLATMAVLIVTSSLILARVQTRYWRDSVSLWTHTLACTSRNWLAHSNLGAALVERRKFKEAIFHCERALQLFPDLPEAHNNLGMALIAQGKSSEGIPHCERALQLRPDYANAHYSLGLGLAQQGKRDAAIVRFERALQLNPDYAAAHDGLGLALAQQSRWNEAIAQYQRALQLNADNAEPHHHLGVALAAQGKVNEAIPQYERALQLNPDYAEAHIDLGLALAQQSKWNEAIAQYQRALQLNPDFTEAHINLGLALAQQSKWNEAMAQYQRALQLNPDSAYAAGNLAWLLATCSEAQFRNPTEALRLAHRADELHKSQVPEVLDTLAAAQAASGDFARAVETAQQAMALATSASNQVLVGVIQSHLQLYQAGKPFYESAGRGEEKP